MNNCSEGPLLFSKLLSICNIVWHGVSSDLPHSLVSLPLSATNQLSKYEIKHVLLAVTQSRSLPDAQDESRDESYDESRE